MYILKNENLTAQISKNPFELVSLKKMAKNMFINRIALEKNHDQFVFQLQEN